MRAGARRPSSMDSHSVTSAAPRSSASDMPGSALAIAVEIGGFEHEVAVAEARARRQHPLRRARSGRQRRRPSRPVRFSALMLHCAA